MIGDGLAMYCAIPTRLRHLGSEFAKLAFAEGFAPTLPHDLGPFEYFEGNPRFGRGKTLELMNRVMACYPAMGIFGISAGVLGELDLALALRRIGDQKLIRVYPGLDPLWDEEYRKLAPKYRFPLERLRGEHVMIVFVGGRGVGKTFHANRAQKELGCKKIRTTTTRPARDDADHESYYFIGRDEFLARKENGDFLEWDEYNGHFYGSTLQEIRKVLETHHGILALTPRGASALSRHRYEINIACYLLKAESHLLLENLRRRKITDPKEIESAIRDNESFNLPPEVEHTRFVLSGDDKNDLQLMESIKQKIEQAGRIPSAI